MTILSHFLVWQRHVSHYGCGIAKKGTSLMPKPIHMAQKNKNKKIPMQVESGVESY